MYLKAIANIPAQHAFTQRECWDLLMESDTPSRLRARSVTLLERVLLGNNGVDKRHFCIDDPTKLFELDAERLNREYEQTAPALATRAAEVALERAEALPHEVDALLVCTCTGYICPGLTSHVAQRINLRPDTYLLDIVGLGCGAAIPTLRNAHLMLQGQPDLKVLVVAVEVCSAAFYLDDDPGVLISACIFGDGASASLWTGQPDNGNLRLYDFDTLHLPEQRETIRFVNSEGKLRNQLHRSVPQQAADAVSMLYDRSLERTEKEPEQIISHTGGRDVLLALGEAFPHYNLRESTEILRRYGNMSSPSVLFALEEYLSGRCPENDLWLTAFGAGFACHSCRLAVPE